MRRGVFISFPVLLLRTEVRLTVPAVDFDRSDKSTFIILYTHARRYRYTSREYMYIYIDIDKRFLSWARQEDTY